ncbi:hypothetical protein PQO01_16060 [Lentisphaera marina]|uniref:LamG-like jellyroll fold domain-containing protein n=1 Tax=Lentisphaera marina TaxID=1111041 RepID=UPI0023655899|nr:LamG-like jellyroll fold domain-containing protein [Lentisphaera marina]MDD7986466.1 hypothetical protein [Lentisphaera marina]
MNQRLEELCGLMFEQTLSKSEAEELNKLLDESTENRHFYYDLCEAHALLKDQYQDFKLPQNNDLPKSTKKWKVIINITSALAALFIVAFIFTNISQKAAKKNNPPQLPYRGVSLATLDTSIGSQFEFGDSQGLQPKAGDNFKEGAYILNQGIIQLNYGNGAQAIIEAPAEFNMISEKLITCTNGKISVYAPETAKNFTVRSPVADVVDLGTEFSVWIKANEFVEAHVYKGSVNVDLSIIGSNKNRQLLAQNAVRIIYEENETHGKENISINDIDLRNDFFIRNLKEPDNKYSKFITSLGPVAYFPMEMSKDGSSLSDWSSYKNDASANHIAHKDNLLVPGKSGNALHLSGANHRGFLYVPDYPKSPLGELSVSAWVYAKSRASWGTIIKNWGNKEWGQFHFGLNEKGFLDVEIMTKDYEKVHIRENIKLPTGSWQHVAFVHNGSEVHLYRNGKLLSSKKVNGLSLRGKLKSLGIGTKICAASAEIRQLGIFS